MKISHFLATTALAFSGATAFAANMDTDTTASRTQFDSVVITFDQANSLISGPDQDMLTAAVNSAKARGTIKTIEVAAWSDSVHPTSGDLPKTSIQLADDRINSIKRALRPEVGKTKVIHTFNMAGNTNWLARSFNTSEAQLDSMYSKGTTPSMAREDLNLIKANGAPSKAVVIIKTKE